MTRLVSAFLIVSLAACTDLGGSVCDEAEALVVECGGAASDVDFGECTGEVEEAAEKIVSGGCEALSDQKGDALSQLCLGPLADFFPWCTAEAYRCEPTAADLDSDLCNGSAELCGRPYDEVVFPTSHNAFSAATLGFIRPNQSSRMYVQLRDGMRALMVDGHHDSDGKLSMCHVDCALGSTGFEEGLAEIADFLDCYPNEVISLIIEPHADGIEFARAIEAAGLAEHAYAHQPGTAWPTLKEMIDAGTRLVVFAEKPGEGTPDWYHHQWDFAFDNEFSVKKVEDFACELERGESNSPIFGLNHFLTVLGGDEFLAIDANTAESIHGHVEQCRDTFGQLPTFLAVDFHDIGDVVEVAAELNF